MAKRTRVCSFCSEPGHTIRSCVEAKRAKKIKKKQPTSPSVVVRVVHDAKSSPHVVNLKPEDVRERIQVTAFREKMATIHEPREAIDIAALVREANAKQQKKEQLILPPEIKPYREVAAKTPSVSLGARVRAAGASIRARLYAARKASAAPIVREEKARHTFVFPAFSFRTFGVTVMAGLIIVGLPFPAIGYYKKVKNTQARVIDQSATAFLALQASTLAAFQSDLGSAQNDLHVALSAFSEAQQIVDREHRVLQYVAGMVPMLGNQVRSRQHVLLAGHHLALGNTYLVKGIDAAQSNPDMAVSEKVDILRTHLKSAMPQYEKALEDLSYIDQASIPVEYQQSFSEFKLLFAAFINDMQDLVDLIDVVNVMFGAEEFKRYLIVFQNNHEIRPTGGFMGSFAIVDVQKGKIEHVDVPPGGTYDLQGQLDEYVKPPLPLQLVDGRWEFQDANWFPDFAASAKKMSWFYQHGRGATVDGVIAINASVLERFLRVMGPVKTTDKYNLILDADSVLSQLQHEVETGKDKQENKPKQIISELLGQLLGGVGDLSKGEMLRLLSEVHEAAEQKEIQVYMNDPALQERLRAYGWTGEIAASAPTQDYLMVVNTNLRGQKSDARIEQLVTYSAQVQDDGTILATAKVKRTHTGNPSEAHYGVLNVNFIRVMVPEGAELIDAGGFSYPPETLFHVPESWYKDDADLLRYEREEGLHKASGTRVTSEFGKTSFGNWMMVVPGTSQEVFFTYRLPFKIDVEKHVSDSRLAGIKDRLFSSPHHPSRYSLLLQKQSGVDSRVDATVAYPEGWQPVWKLHDNILLQEGKARLEIPLTSDTAFGVIMEKSE